MMILATINSQTYHIDVGFSNFGALTPMLLAENVTADCAPGLKVRLVRRVIPDSVTDQKLWVVEMQDSHSKVWNNGYCFSETEFLPQDFSNMNFRTMTDPASWFTSTFILTKLLLEDCGENGVDRKVVGALTMFDDTLERRIDGGEAEVLLTCKSESERVEALEKWFGVVLSDEEKEGIKGFKSEIMKGSS
jgi:arylamine N-acetyltransferase